MDIPRPDLMFEGSDDSYVVEEAYSGQGGEVQNLVYSRLARFTNLETLALTGISRRRNNSSCLEFWLESGLYRLEGLKALQELDVRHMTTWIDEEEIQWMTEHWPRLRIIRGEVIGKESAKKWLEERRINITISDD